MSDFLKGLVVASLEEIENGDGAPAEAVSDEVIEAIEAAITAVNEAHDEVVASSSDVEKLEDIANALQETLVVAQESLVDGVLPAYAQQFMTVSLRHAYRRIGLESETVNETPATDAAAAPVVAEVADTVPVAEGGTDATEHGPGVPEVEPATPVDAEVPETGTAEPIATLPVESHGTTEAPVVPESNSMSMESFGDNVKAFIAALVKALKAAWEKIVSFYDKLSGVTSGTRRLIKAKETMIKKSTSLKFEINGSDLKSALEHAAENAIPGLTEAAEKTINAHDASVAVKTIEKFNKAYSDVISPINDSEIITKAEALDWCKAIDQICIRVQNNEGDVKSNLKNVDNLVKSIKGDLDAEQKKAILDAVKAAREALGASTQLARATIMATHKVAVSIKPDSK
jgi:hypothetical protein